MSDTEHSEDEANLPSAAECQKAIDNFVQFTATDEALAQFYLQVHSKLTFTYLDWIDIIVFLMTEKVVIIFNI